jgi:hypothetical protein
VFIRQLLAEVFRINFDTSQPAEKPMAQQSPNGPARDRSVNPCHGYQS